jgi:hypothetical protein
MPLASGCQHIAPATTNHYRFIDFYTRIFDARTVCDMTEGPMRHAMVDLGGGVSDGTLTDFGMLDLVTFHDPDGMDAEVAPQKPGAPKRF